MGEPAEAPPITSGLLAAVRRGEMQLRYQPVVSLATGEIVAFEALLRWEHPMFGSLHPSAFLPEVEDGPDAAELERWALLSACCAATWWPDPVQVALNVYPPRLAESDFFDRVRCALVASALAPSRLQIELVERAPLLANPHVTITMERLRALGVSVALDDFLVHYSSLGSLRSFPASTVKLDRSFVAPLNAGQRSPIAEAVVQLAQALGVPVVAEGVETHQGEAAVRALGCQMAQGYLYSPAVPVQRTASLLATFGASGDRTLGTAP